MSDTLAAALELHAAGYSVIPIRPDGTKAPALPSWKQHTTERAAEDQVRAWFTDAAGYDLGVVQGHVSGNAVLVEIEGRAAGRLPELRDLAHDTGLGDLWDTVTRGWVEMSPSGGFHFHVRIESHQLVLGNQKLARAADKLVLAETRGEGGQVVVAPSRHHTTGRPWTRLIGSPATAPVLSAEDLETFCDLLRTLDETPPAPEPAPARTTGPRDPADGITPGDDYEARTDWADILTPHGWTHVTTRGRTRYWRRPGKNTGFSATTGHADDRDRLYVFTSSTEFDQEVPYTKLGALAVLEHGGDHSAAAKALAAAGFGARRDLQLISGGLDGLIIPGTPAGHAGTPLSRGTAAPMLTAGTSALAPAPDPDDDETPALPPSWAPVDLTPYLDGTWTPAEPTMLVRTDSVALLYPGLVHDFHGESESGKSLIAQAETAARIQAGADVLYVDFESDAGQVTARLLAFGCTPTQLRAHLTYVRPDASPYALAESTAWGQLLAHAFVLAVLDGVTDALGQFGAASKDNDDIATWHRLVPRTLAVRTGAAVVLVDHVVKATEGRGRFAIGGQTKMAAIDGASYLVEVDQPLGKGLAGVVVLRIGKDRPGSIRPACGTWRALDRTQEAARVTIDSTSGDGTIHVTVDPPTTHISDRTGDDGKAFRPTGIMEKISRLLETRGEPVSYRQLLDAYKHDGGTGRERTVADAVALLVDGGHLTETRGARNARMLRSAGAYRQRTDPLSDGYVPPLDGLIVPTDTTVSHRLPTVSGDGETTVSRTVSPVGGTGDGQYAGDTPPSPATHGDSHHRVMNPLFAPTDPTTGLRYDPRTGEVL